MNPTNPTTTATLATPVRVRVPATTSNLGPGFDALGLALGLYNTVTATPAPALEITVAGEGAADLPRDASNLLYRALVRGCEAAGLSAGPPPLRLACEHAIPPARGLGSSAAAVVAGLLLADALAHGALGRDGVLALATEMEGHPDNAAPAVFGGLQAAVHARDGAVHRATVACAAPAGLPRVALFVPDFTMATREARAVLPATLSRADAVFNLSRTALLVAALAGGHDALLAIGTEDALHQRPRAQALFPALYTLFDAARAAGALGAWLSGAGSTVAAFARPARAQAVADAMAAAARAQGISGRPLVATVDDAGAAVDAVTSA